MKFFSECRVRWRTGNEIAVKFLGQASLHSPALSMKMSPSRLHRSRERGKIVQPVYARCEFLNLISRVTQKAAF